MEFETGDFEFSRSRAVPDVEGLNGIALAEAEPLHGTVRNIEKRGEVPIVAIAKKEAVARNEPDEMFEGGFDGFEVGEDVGVVELEIVDEGDLGEVMDEFAAFVEESGVVFVALNDEPFTVRKASALAEVVGDAAD